LDTSDIFANRFDRTVELRLPAARDKHIGTFSDEAFDGSQTNPAVSPY
jgi:hypothetical protein